MTPKNISVDSKGNVKIHYSKIKEVVDHLNREHGMEGKCEAISFLNKLWSMGCDAECSAREKRQ